MSNFFKCYKDLFTMNSLKQVYNLINKYKGLKKSTKKILKEKQTKDDGDTSDEDDVRSKMSKMSVKTGKSTYKPGGKGLNCS